MPNNEEGCKYKKVKNIVHIRQIKAGFSGLPSPGRCVSPEAVSSQPQFWTEFVSADGPPPRGRRYVLQDKNKSP